MLADDSYEPVLSQTIVASVDAALAASTPGFVESIRMTTFTRKSARCGVANDSGNKGTSDRLCTNLSQNVSRARRQY